MDNVGRWFVRRNDQQWGPLTEGQFFELRSAGTLQVGDWIWHSTWADWKPFGLPEPPSIPRRQSQSERRKLFESLLGEPHVWDHPSSQRATIFSELIDGALTTDGDPKQLAAEIDQLVTLATWCFRRDDGYEDEDTNSLNLWTHRNLAVAFRDGYTSPEACPRDTDEMGNVAGVYLRQNLRSPTLEVLLLDAMVASEAYNFGEELKRNPSRFEKGLNWSYWISSMDEAEEYQKAEGNLDKLYWPRWKRILSLKLRNFTLVVIIPLSLAFAAQKNFPSLATFCFGFASLAAIYLLIRWAWRSAKSLLGLHKKGGFEKSAELLQQMADGYSELKGGTATSPTRIREVLKALSDDGAVWNPSVFALLDCAIARSPGKWGP